MRHGTGLRQEIWRLELTRTEIETPPTLGLRRGGSRRDAKANSEPLKLAIHAATDIAEDIAERLDIAFDEVWAQAGKETFVVHRMSQQKKCEVGFVKRGPAI